jgi:putative ABC transport system ATP-binding protein
MTKSSSHSKPILKLVNITKTFTLGNVEIQALKSINLEIYPGELISIVGPSGSGKSTLLQIAGLLDLPTSGQIFLDGQPINNFKENALAKIRNQQIGFIFQQFNLLKKTTALDNVALPLIYANVSRTEQIARAKSTLEKVGLGDRMYNQPTQLSGGQQQRVAIARALVNSPNIIFADEPTGNLDSHSGESIISLLKQLNSEGKTIVIVTHDPDVADVAPRKITFKDGEILSDHIKTT